ncbi:MAG TPA: hypothetical protein PKW87_08885 [Bacillota bacterium]|jgi:hypothetical protein|nr:hypothetical protein [Bacillota bacterium]
MTVGRSCRRLAREAVSVSRQDGIAAFGKLKDQVVSDLMVAARAGRTKCAWYITIPAGIDRDAYMIGFTDAAEAFAEKENLVCETTLPLCVERGDGCDCMMMTLHPCDSDDVPNPDNRPILAVDFDGVIHSYKSGWTGSAECIDPPVEGAIEALKELNSRFRIVIHSSRALMRYPGGREAIVAYLKKYDIPYSEIVVEKPPAYVFVDDRCLTFRGDWKKTLEEIKNFKHWFQGSGSVLSSIATRESTRASDD